MIKGFVKCSDQMPTKYPVWVRDCETRLGFYAQSEAPLQASIKAGTDISEYEWLDESETPVTPNNTLTMTKDNAIAEANKWSRPFESEEDILHRAMDIYAKFKAGEAWDAWIKHEWNADSPNKEQFLNQQFPQSKPTSNE